MLVILRGKGKKMREKMNVIGESKRGKIEGKTENKAKKKKRHTEDINCESTARLEKYSGDAEEEKKKHSQVMFFFFFVFAGVPGSPQGLERKDRLSFLSVYFVVTLQ